MNELPPIPKRPLDGHKGTFGTVAILGGHISDETVMLGSAAFVAKAAIRSGVGMVTFLGPRNVLVELIKMVPPAVGVSPDNDLKTLAKKWSAIVIGPGLGVDLGNLKLIADLLDLRLGTVVDADGLNMVAAHPELIQHVHDQCLLTPHVKEFERLAKALDIDSQDPKATTAMATKLHCTVVVKSHRTTVADPHHRWQSDSGNVTLATAGSGDVLAGLIRGLLTQFAPIQLSTYNCARLGVAIHGRAADTWRETHGTGGLLLDELLELIPQTIDALRQP